MSAGPLAEASAGTLRALATALRNGQLGPAITRMALARVAQCPESITAELCRLSAEGLAPSHMALLLEIAADAAEQRLSGGVPVSLVWTGPESAVSQSRDTAVVVEELFAHAERFVLVSSYVVQKGTTVFRAYWPNAWWRDRSSGFGYSFTSVASGGTRAMNRNCSERSQLIYWSSGPAHVGRRYFTIRARCPQTRPFGRRGMPSV
jgi:hypothetical protein